MAPASEAPATNPRPSSEASQPALPFREASGARPAEASKKLFTINQFASLTAEIAENPDRAPEIRKRYGITDAQHHAESQRWTEDFAANGELRQRYFGIVRRYREYLKNQKR
jgi:hypothetical protein